MKYVTLIQDGLIHTSSFFGRSYRYGNDVELALQAARLIDRGYAFVDTPHGWPPAAILQELQAQRVLCKTFTAITWEGPGKYRTYPVAPP